MLDCQVCDRRILTGEMISWGYHMSRHTSHCSAQPVRPGSTIVSTLQNSDEYSIRSKQRKTVRVLMEKLLTSGECEGVSMDDMCCIVHKQGGKGKAGASAEDSR